MVAVVDGERILASVLEQRVVPLTSDLDAIRDPTERQRALDARRGAALVRLVDERIAATEARVAHITVDDGQVDRAVQVLADQRHATVDQLYEAAAQLGVSREPYRDMVRAEVIRLRVIQHAVPPRTEVSDDEITEAYTSRPDPRPPLDQVRDALREQIVAVRLECAEHSWSREARARHGVQLLIEVPPDEPPAVGHATVARDHVYFVGNAAVTTDALRALLPPGDRIALDAQGQLPGTVLEAISPIYFDRGYLGVRVHTAPEHIDPCDPHVDHTVVEITEGPRFRLASLRAQELDEHEHPIEPLLGQAALSRMVHRTGEWFERAALRRDLQSIEAAYRERGYASVSVLPVVVPHDASIDVTITVRRGPLVRVARIEVHGGDGIPPETLARAITVTRDAPYDPTQVRATRQNLEALHRFASVTISTAPIDGHPDQVALVIELRPRP